MKNVSSAFNFVGAQGLAVSTEGKLIDSVFGLEINGVGMSAEYNSEMATTQEDWEDEDFNRLS